MGFKISLLFDTLSHGFGVFDCYKYKNSLNKSAVYGLKNGIDILPIVITITNE